MFFSPLSIAITSLGEQRANLSGLELGRTKTYERISTDERSIVNTHSIDITAKFVVSIKEKQRLPEIYWLPKLHKRPYKARFIANSISCTTTVFVQTANFMPYCC